MRTLRVLLPTRRIPGAIRQLVGACGVKGETSFSSMGKAGRLAALRMDIALLPNEEKTFVFTLGYGRNPRDQKLIAPNVIPQG
jgi:hypothetical protein